jgi:hypothetical protein
MPMTEQLSDKNLVNVAKQKYENQQRSTVPSVVVPLPSGGLVYAKSNPLRAGSVEMRYMTAYDEDILTNSSYIRQGTVLDRLIKALLITDININDLVIADKDALIIAARIHGYGSEYGVTVTDPNTNKTLERVLNLADLEKKPFTLQPDSNGEFDYDLNETPIKFKFLSRNELNSISDDHALSDFLKLSIKQIGESRDQVVIDNYVKYQMKPIQSKQLRTYISNNMPGLKLEAEFQGEDGGTFTAGFQIGSDLFWF